MSLRERLAVSTVWRRTLTALLLRRLGSSTTGPPSLVALAFSVLKTFATRAMTPIAMATRTFGGQCLTNACHIAHQRCNRCNRGGAFDSNRGGAFDSNRGGAFDSNRGGAFDSSPTPHELAQALLIRSGYSKCRGVLANTGLSSQTASAAAPAMLSSANAPRSASNVSAQRRVIYIDQPDSWYPPEAEAATITAAVDAGFNVIILAFWCSNGQQIPGGACDMCAAWERDVPPQLQISTVQYAHSKGAIVMAAAGGATDYPWESLSGSNFGTLAANWAVRNNLDGVDFDVENYQQGFVMYPGSTSQQAVDYLVDATKAARSVLAVLPTPTYISHAPQVPYFGPVGGSSLEYWAGALGGYTSVYLALPSGSIDFFNMQFYNQGGGMYVDYAGLFQISGSDFPGTAVTQLASYGIPLSTIVVGKYLDPDNPSDGVNGYVDPLTLGQFLGQAQKQYAFTPSVMVWQWPGKSQGGGGQPVAQQWLQQVLAGISAA
jgi:hypothetical protein